MTTTAAQVAALPLGGSLRFFGCYGLPYKAVREPDGFAVYVLDTVDGDSKIHSYGTPASVARIAAQVARRPETYFAR